MSVPQYPLDEAQVIELDGPPMAYFEIPLPYFATPNGELEPEGHPEASRLVMRIDYQNFHVRDNTAVMIVIERVTRRLRELGGGFIWWRLHPSYAEDRTMRLRFGTTPELPPPWWAELRRDVGDRN